jgi:hypothetical protein
MSTDDWIWRLDLLFRNMVLDPGDENVRKEFELELIQKQQQGFDRIEIEPGEDFEYSFDAVKNAELIFIVNKSRTSNIYYRVNGLYENIPLESFTLLTNGTDWGKLDRLAFKSTNQTDDAEILLLVLGTKEKYSGDGNP